MLLGGILVGAAGTILTVLMCQAMNRSLLNVLVGGFSSSGSSSKSSEQGDIKEITDSDFAVQLFYSQNLQFLLNLNRLDNPLHRRILKLPVLLLS